MNIRHPWVKGLVYTLAAVVFCGIGFAPSDSIAQALPDTLTLQKPENVTLWRTFDAGRSLFKVFVTWEEPPDSIAALIHQPDTLAWSLVTSADSLAMPESRGSYSGSIDRTVEFRAIQGGIVGQGQIQIQYVIRREEKWSGIVDIGAPYTPGSWIPILFTDSDPESPTFGQTVDAGLELSFTPGTSFDPGIIDAQGQFVVGLEDFEGYHIWRGIKPDGSDLEVIGEISKEEAFNGSGAGGSFGDSLYLNEIIPALRGPDGVYHAPFSIECLGFTIDAPLEYNELLWFDCNAFNGFTYYYLVTTFDRGYNVSSGRQGLFKFDRCQPSDTTWTPECQQEMVSIGIEVNAQNDLQAVYAVPNPFRTGGSRLTTENYHNFPDEKVRFVNVPTSCKLKIFTVSGDLVWEYDHNGGGNIEWDTTNRGGESVASGVYIFKVEDPGGGQVLGRLIVIR